MTKKGRPVMKKCSERMQDIKQKPAPKRSVHRTLKEFTPNKDCAHVSREARKSKSAAVLNRATHKKGAAGKNNFKGNMYVTIQSA